MSVRPSILAYQDYLRFGDRCLPDIDGDGSALLWHEFRIIDDIYQQWKAAKENAAYNGGHDAEPEMKEDGSGYQSPPPLKGPNRIGRSTET